MKKWAYRALAVLAVLVVALVGAVLWSAERTTHPVGLAVARVAGAAKPFAVVIWYPTSGTAWPTTQLGITLMSVARDGPVDGRQLPLVVVSHGNGGGPGSHADLALALADAGYVVAAPMHAGDNLEDSTGASGPTFWSNRSRELRATVDYMLEAWPARDHLDRARIGAFGFSAGAFTVLTAVGGRPDLGMVRSHCAATPEFVCEALRASNSPLLVEGGARADHDFVADPRIVAAVVAAPGLGFAFAGGGLENVRVPVQLWIGESDRVAPEATNGAVIRAALGPSADVHSVPAAGHASFLAPCRLLRPPALCSDAGAFDRTAFHARMNADIVRFLDEKLRRPARR